MMKEMNQIEACYVSNPDAGYDSAEIVTSKTQYMRFCLEYDRCNSTYTYDPDDHSVVFRANHGTHAECLVLGYASDAENDDLAIDEILIDLYDQGRFEAWRLDDADSLFEAIAQFDPEREAAQLQFYQSKLDELLAV